MTTYERTFLDIRDILVRTLDIQDRAASIEPSTALLGGLPELDSFAVVELAAAIEAKFHIEIDEDDFTGEVFETVDTLVQFVNSQL